MATRMHPQPMKISNHKTFCMILSSPKNCALRALPARRYVRCVHGVTCVAGTALGTLPTATRCPRAPHITARAGNALNASRKEKPARGILVLFRRLSQDSAVPPAKGLDETCAELPNQPGYVEIEFRGVCLRCVREMCPRRLSAVRTEQYVCVSLGLGRFVLMDGK